MTMKGKTQEVFQTIVNSRKSYKMLKGNTEVVWPPYLEEAMLKGFESYQPEDCRETRLLGRFPMRNQFISEYIYHATGKRRSAKQVGSRLQQLRDTYEGRRLLAQLSSHYKLGGKPISSSASFTSESSDNPSIFDSPNSPGSSSQSSIRHQSPPTPLDSTLERRTFIRIDILPSKPSLSCPPHSPSSEDISPVFSSNGITDVFRPSSFPRPIYSIDPTITLLAHNLLAARSVCSVLHDGALVHEEITELVLVGPVGLGPCGEGEEGGGGGSSKLLYSVRLVPKFWDRICQSQDPTRFTIVQKVTRVPNGGPPTEEDPSIFSALYYFNYPPVNPNPYFPYQDQIQNPNQNQNQNPTLTPPSLWDTPNAYDSRECSESPIDPFPHQPQPQPPLMLDTHTHTQIQAPFPSSSFPTHSFMDPTPSFDIDIDLNLNYGCL